MFVRARFPAVSLLALSAAAVGCSEPEVYGHHDLIVQVSYDGADQEFRLPFRCQDDGSSGIARGGSPSPSPSPYLYHALPDGSGLAILTPRICRTAGLRENIDDPASKIVAPYSGDILIPPVAWLNDLERPSVVVYWASASAMRSASKGLVVRSARVEPRSVPGNPIEDRGSTWSSAPKLLRGGSGEDQSCGVAFLISQGPKPGGMMPTDVSGIDVSAVPRNFMLDDDFGTRGRPYSAAEFNNLGPPSGHTDRFRRMRERASSVHPLTFEQADGWTLTQSPDLVGRYIVYRLEPNDAERHDTFSFKGQSLPFTYSRQIWIERDQTLLTPIGYCNHEIANM